MVFGVNLDRVIGFQGLACNNRDDTTVAEGLILHDVADLANVFLEYVRLNANMLETMGYLTISDMMVRDQSRGVVRRVRGS